MKKLMGAIAVVLFASIATNAQEIPDRKRDESKPVLKEKIMDKKERAELNLTDEQKAKLKSMNTDLRKQMEDLRKQDNITVKEYREKMESLRQERETQFQSVLTDDQKAQVRKYHEARTERTKEFGAKRLEKMKQNLNLTDEQVTRLKENREKTMEKVKTIREDKSLSDDQKREQVKSVMKSQRENLKTILSDEQMKKMKEHRKHHSSKKRQQQ